MINREAIQQKFLSAENEARRDAQAVSEVCRKVQDLLTALEKETGRPVSGIEITTMGVSLLSHQHPPRIVALSLGPKAGEGWR